MKKLVFTFLCLVLPLSIAFGAGSFDYKNELLPILSQDPYLLDFLEDNFILSDSGSANRIGYPVNKHLGGKRIGPYQILIQTKKYNKIVWYKLIVNTKVVYLDENGNESTLLEGVSLKENIVSVEIKRIEYGKEKKRLTIH